MKTVLRSLVARGVGLALFTASPIVAGIAIKDGEKVAFLGDSITEGGWGHPLGYVRLVVAGLATNGIRIHVVPAGVSGHKSNQMLERLRRDVLDKKPDWMTLSCGVNDVWHGEKGVPLDLYKNNMAAIVDFAQEAGVKVMILTATPIGENPDNANNQKLALYNQFLREKAKEKGCLLADLSADFQARLRERAPGAKGNLLTTDGVHMNTAGNLLMATGVLRAFGADTTQLRQAEEAWKDIPGGGRMAFGFKDGSGKELQGSLNVTLRAREKFAARAARQSKAPEDVLQVLFNEEARKFLKPSGEFESVQAIFDAGREKQIQADLQKGFRQRARQWLTEETEE